MNLFSIVMILARKVFQMYTNMRFSCNIIIAYASSMRSTAVKYTKATATHLKRDDVISPTTLVCHCPPKLSVLLPCRTKCTLNVLQFYYPLIWEISHTTLATQSSNAPATCRQRQFCNWQNISVKMNKSRTLNECLFATAVNTDTCQSKADYNWR